MSSKKTVLANHTVQVTKERNPDVHQKYQFTDEIIEERGDILKIVSYTPLGKSSVGSAPSR